MNLGFRRVAAIGASALLLMGASSTAAWAADDPQDPERLDISATVNGQSGKHFLVSPGSQVPATIVVGGEPATWAKTSVTVTYNGRPQRERPCVAQPLGTGEVARCTTTLGVPDSGDASYTVYFEGTGPKGGTTGAWDTLEVRGRSLATMLWLNGVRYPSGVAPVLRNSTGNSVAVTVTNTTAYTLTDLQMPWLNGTTCKLGTLAPGRTGTCSASGVTFTSEMSVGGMISGGSDPIVAYSFAPLKFTFAAPTGFAFPRDVTGDKKADIVAVAQDGKLTELAGNGNGTFGASRVTSAADYRGYKHLLHVGDWDGAPAGDLWAVDPSDTLWIKHRRVHSGGWDVNTPVGCCGWNAFTNLFSPGDLDADGRSDVLAVRPDGTLLFYKHNANGTTGPARVIGTGWNAFTQVFAAGDVNGDGRTDVMAVDKKGALWLYPSLGGARFDVGRKVGTNGWGAFTDVVGIGDANGDGRHDIVALDTAGRLWLYPNGGKGGTFPTRALIREGMTGWRLVK